MCGCNMYLCLYQVVINLHQAVDMLRVYSTRDVLTVSQPLIYFLADIFKSVIEGHRKINPLFWVER